MPRFIKSYLQRREQQVIINGAVSKKLPVRPELEGTMIALYAGLQIRVQHWGDDQHILVIFSRPTSFLQKAVERVDSEKNILNSSVEWSGVEWSGFFRKKLYVCTSSDPPQ